MALARLGGAQVAIELTNTEFHRLSRSDTFHGRDLFGPVAAYLARGTDVELLGAEAGALANPYTLPAPRKELDHQVGQVLHVDTYGNLVTSFTQDVLPPRFEVVVGDRRIRGGPAHHYQAVDTGELLAVIGSAGLLELSVRDGSAAMMLGLDRDAPVVVRPFGA
jgi:S-adenosylmethionine hydrolase